MVTRYYILLARCEPYLPQGNRAVQLHGLFATPVISVMLYWEAGMELANISKRLKHLWHEYGSMNNIVIVVALLIAAAWAWGSISTMQRNFALQKAVDAQKRELEIATLEVQKLQFEQNYYGSDEYKDLAAREHLGLAGEGEKVLLLPANSPSIKQESKVAENPVGVAVAPNTATQSNFDQWMVFLSGAAARGIEE